MTNISSMGYRGQTYRPLGIEKQLPEVTFGGFSDKVRKHKKSITIGGLLLSALSMVASQTAPLMTGLNKQQSTVRATAITRAQETTQAEKFYQLLDRYYQDWQHQTLTQTKLAFYKESLAQIDAKKLEPRDRAFNMMMAKDVDWKIFESQNLQYLRKSGIRTGSPMNWVDQLVYDTRTGRDSVTTFQNSDIAGKPLYDAILKHRGYVNLTSDELIRLSTSEFDKYKTRMDALAKTIDPSAKDWRPVYEEMLKDHPTKENVLNVYRQEAQKAEKFLKDNKIIRIPDGFELTVAETPRYYWSQLPFAAYLPSKMEFWVTIKTTPNPTPEEWERQLRNHSYSWIGPVTVHEAFPGHHVQNLHSYTSDDDGLAGNDKHSDARQYLMEMADWDSPYYTEGWGLHSERVMLDAGYYNNAADPKTQAKKELAAQRALLWRSARALLDPKIHTGQISFDQAVTFLSENLVMDRDRAEGEVRRYYQYPTQVTSYYLGMLQFRDMWEQVKAQKPNTTMEEFHDQILKRVLPLPALAMMRFGVEMKDLQPPPVK